MVIFFGETGKNQIYSLSPPSFFLWSALGSRKISTPNQKHYEKIFMEGHLKHKKNPLGKLEYSLHQQV